MATPDAEGAVQRTQCSKRCAQPPKAASEFGAEHAARHTGHGARGRKHCRYTQQGRHKNACPQTCQACGRASGASQAPHTAAATNAPSSSSLQLPLPFIGTDSDRDSDRDSESESDSDSNSDSESDRDSDRDGDTQE
jgi:hypothetical protein